ncbi:sensor histidine kinase [Anaeromicrobium sediminis]|nr:HAMP domain-containing sensor histidine kinase [Anaeromicrobium sediminis]
MNKVGLTTKLFIVLFLTFVIVIGAIFIGIVNYFEPYFVGTQIKNIEEDIQRFLEESKENGRLEEKDLTNLVTDFTASNVQPLAIMRDRDVFFPRRSQIIYLESEYGITRVDLGDAIFQIQNKGTKIIKGMNLSFVGYWVEDKFMGLSIYDLTEDKLSELRASFNYKLPQITRITGKVIDYELATYESGSIYRQDMMYQMTNSGNLKPETVNKNSYVIENVDVKTGIKNYLVVIPYGDIYAFSLYSLQPVTEVIELIPQFLIYVILLTIFLLILILLLVTKLVVKPILNINNITKKISNLDFKDRLVVKSSDEIGMISSNVNKMADKLEITLRELEESNKQLKEELKLKEEFEEARKRFVADASHELKTPLGIVRAYTERLEDKYIYEDKAKYYTSIILDENRKMNKLINDLLELSKLESKMDMLQRREFNLSQEMLDLVERFYPIYEEKGTQLLVDVESDIFIYADLERINQVFTNMMSNALKYAPAGTTVYLSLKKDNQGIHCYIKNQVEDIQKIDLLRIWDRFYKADTARSRKLGGFGLGLSITKSILDLHGFDFGVQNRDNFIHFYVNIPLS